MDPIVSPVLPVESLNVTHEYAWSELSRLGGLPIVARLQVREVREVALDLITLAFGECLKDDGLDPKRPMTVRWSNLTGSRDTYLFEQSA
jgi:hypothetical protein